MLETLPTQMEITKSDILHDKRLEMSTQQYMDVALGQLSTPITIIYNNYAEERNVITTVSVDLLLPGKAIQHDYYSHASCDGN